MLKVTPMALALFMVWACSDSTPSTCTAGNLGCECFANSTCHNDLACDGSVCVPGPSDGASGDTPTGDAPIGDVRSGDLVDGDLAGGDLLGGDTAECTTSGDCTGGWVCLMQVCRLLCSRDRDCPAIEICGGAGVCEVGSRPPPGIDTVDGTGTLDLMGGHTAHHLVDDLVVSGTNLDGTSFTLSDGTNTWDLNACNQTNTSAQLELPTGLVAGTYVLTAANQGGSCQATLPILQGQQGPAGQDGFANCSRFGGTGTISCGSMRMTGGFCSCPGADVVSSHNINTPAGNVGGSMSCTCTGTAMATVDVMCCN